MATTRKFQNKAKTLVGQAELRQRFIDAGKALLKESPDSEPTLRQVAAYTGYSPSALYRYFSTKAELMYAIREEYIDRSVAFASTQLGGCSNATTRLRVAFEAIVQFWADNPDEFRHVYSYRPRTEPTDPVKVLIRDTASIQSARAFNVTLVREFFAAHNLEPDNELLGQLTDSLVVASHGVVAIPLGSPSVTYCASALMARASIQGFISSWRDFIAFIETHRLTRRPTAEQFHNYLNTLAKLG